MRLQPTPKATTKALQRIHALGRNQAKTAAAVKAVTVCPEGKLWV